ncbi:MAG: aminotransferase class V-fold PLP-dependent enzyme [Acidimicrobiales bacterium]
MLVDPSLFPGTKSLTYLNTGSMALGHRPGSEALSNAAAQWQAGQFDWMEAERVGEDLRSTVAGLIGARGNQLALVVGASGGAASVAAQLPDSDGTANIVVPARDFASNFLAWKMLENRGYEVRLVDDVNGALPIDVFAQLVDTNTSVIATSVVQSATGYRVDVDALKSVAAAADAWLVVDASQALGSIRVDVDGLAALFGCSHKWLLGIRGMGYLYVRSDLATDFTPISPGWKSVHDPINSFYGPDLVLADDLARLDSSWPWFDPLVNIEGVRIVAGIGIDAVEQHNMNLVATLEEQGVPVAFDRRHRSPIVSLTAEDPGLPDRLKEAGIVTSARAGRIRVGFHLYNTADDVGLLADVIQS